MVHVYIWLTHLAAEHKLTGHHEATTSQQRLIKKNTEAMIIIVKQRDPPLLFLHQKVSSNPTSEALCQNP